jgi:hypothetical protein
MLYVRRLPSHPIKTPFFFGLRKGRYHTHFLIPLHPYSPILCFISVLLKKIGWLQSHAILYPYKYCDESEQERISQPKNISYDLYFTSYIWLDFRSLDRLEQTY